MKKPLWRYIDPLEITAITLFAILAACICLASCNTTKPLSAHTRPDGTRVGVSKNIVFLTGYNANDGIAVAQDNAGIITIDSIGVQRRVRPFGSSYITTVTGH